MIKSYILTRFNLNLWELDKNKKETRTNDWLEKRFELFEKYCLPSIMTQSCQDFTWIVLFDEDTPTEYVKRYNNYKDECPQFLPIRVKSHAGWYVARIFQEVISKDLAQASTKGEKIEKITTTYLDNDDSLHKDYISMIRNHALKPIARPTFITFIYGLQYFEDLNIATEVKYKNNHFLTLIENVLPNERIKTAYGFGGHGNVFKYRGCVVDTISEKDNPAWLEVIHDTNAKNDVLLHRWTKVVFNHTILKTNFGIDILLRNKGYAKVLLFRYLPKRYKAYYRYLQVKIFGYDRIYGKKK